MLFVEIRFLLFLLLILAVYWALRGKQVRKLWLLAASYTFYAAFDVRFLSLVGVSTLVDYLACIGLGRTDRPLYRRLLVLASLLVNLGIFAYFKYADFFIESAAKLLSAIGFDPSWQTLNIILPVGISFYTFQTMSYTIDVYRGKLEPTKNLLDVALYVGFFPQLVAGPIVRAKEFLPQTRLTHRWRDVDVKVALTLILLGYVQKAVVADNLAPIVDRYYADPHAFGPPAAWLATLLFWVQVYGDFAGYSNMAIGLAALVGYRLPINFNFPFVAPNPSEFWARWHITLSTWINDYVLTPLRRPGQGWLRYCANIVFAMTLFGLWHGAAWKFALWGALNGVAVVLYRTWRRYGRNRVRSWSYPGSGIAAVGLTLFIVTVTVPLFRGVDMGQAVYVMKSMLLLEPAGGQELTAFAGRVAETGLVALLLGMLLLHWLLYRGYGRWTRTMPDLAFAAAYGIAVPVAFALAASALEPYIYFQF